MEEYLKEDIGTVDDAYLVLVGPRGCGKSVGIVAAAEGMEGVIVVTLTSSVSVSAQVIAQVCQDYPVAAAISARKLGDLFRATILKVNGRSHGGNVCYVCAKSSIFLSCFGRLPTTLLLRGN
jgi:hypothetical protein